MCCEEFQISGLMGCKNANYAYNFLTCLGFGALDFHPQGFKDFGRLQRLFWCEMLSVGYKTFRHIRAFDSTYKYNAYDNPLVVLVRVNYNLLFWFGIIG